MRVLVQARADLWAVVAGDTRQVRGTLAGLAAAGVAADLSLEARPDVRPYDLVHVFNLMRVDEAVIQADNARAAGRPVVVTPLYWNRAQVEGGDGRWPGEQRLRERLLRRAAAVVVGAPGEADLLAADFGPGLRCRVVPLGVDRPAAGVPDAEAVRRRTGLADYVLCVARVARHKNQLGLIRALEGLHLPLIFVGPVHEPDYHRLCRQAAPEAVFLGQVDDATLWSAYAGARVHVLASWCELPGLASLEAGVAGANVVSTSRGTARDYLGDDAWYCDPAEPESVRAAVAAAYRAPRDGRLRARALWWTWERAGRELRRVYEEVLGASHGG